MDKPVKRLTYKDFRKFDYKSFLVLVSAVAFIFVSAIYLYRYINQDITNDKGNIQAQTAQKTEPKPAESKPEPIKKLDNKPAKNTAQVSKKADSNTAQKNKVTPAKKQAAKTTSPKTATASPAKAKAKTAPPVKKQVQSKPQNTFSSPEEYLSHVKNLLQSNLHTNYSIDCKVLVVPSKSIKIIQDSWNGDLAYNFTGRYLYKIPKYYDTDGNIKAIVVTFSGHSIASVYFD